MQTRKQRGLVLYILAKGFRKSYAQKIKYSIFFFGEWKSQAQLESGAVAWGEELFVAM